MNDGKMQKNFMIKQLKAQINNLLIEKNFLENELKSVKRCAACRCSGSF